MWKNQNQPQRKGLTNRKLFSGMCTQSLLYLDTQVERHGWKRMGFQDRLWEPSVIFFMRLFSNPINSMSHMLLEPWLRPAMHRATMPLCWLCVGRAGCNWKGFIQPSWGMQMIQRPCPSLNSSTALIIPIHTDRWYLTKESIHYAKCIRL